MHTSGLKRQYNLWKKFFAQSLKEVKFYGKSLRVLLGIWLRGKRGYDVSSVPFKRLERASEYRKKRWKSKRAG